METLLPAVNASLNAVATLLLISGKVLARKRRLLAHRRVMLSAFGVSCLFLLFYVLHKASRDFQNTSFNAEGVAKAAYLVMLFSHVVLAAAVPFLAIAAIRARPIWMYVSLTGVLIYALLYHFNPDA